LDGNMDEEKMMAEIKSGNYWWWREIEERFIHR
jgi:hypothetical protein